jgi:uncharacterized protein YdaU (DUF1376 family)
MAKDGRPTWFRMDFEELFSDGNVVALNAQELGAFIRLLRRAWRETPPASIPDDDTKLARWAGADVSWSDCKSAIVSCFERVGDRLVHPWLLAEYERAACELRKNREKVEKHRKTGTKPLCNGYTSNSDSPVPVRLSWFQVQPIYDSYPKHRRGAPGSFQRHLEAAWSELSAEGHPDPGGFLLGRVRAYAGSWLARNEGGKALLGSERFFLTDRAYMQADGDWAEPGTAPAAAAPTRTGRF